MKITRMDAISATLPASENVTLYVSRACQPATAIRMLNRIASHD